MARLPPAPEFLPSSLIPEWRYLQKPALFPQQANDTGLMVTEMPRGPKLNDRISRVVAVDQMKKVNALLGFTRLDAMDRVSDIATRLVKTHPQWSTHLDTGHRTAAKEFLQLDLPAVEEWKRKSPRASYGLPTARHTPGTSGGDSPRPVRKSTSTAASPHRAIGCSTRCRTS